MKTNDPIRGEEIRYQFYSQRLISSGYHTYCPGEAWKPAVNVYQDDQNYYVVVNLAGVGSSSVDLEYTPGRLIITGHRATPPPPEVHGKLHLLHMEIDHGQFRRTVEMPGPVDADAIEALYRTGQLFVTLPKIF